MKKNVIKTSVLSIALAAILATSVATVKANDNVGNPVELKYISSKTQLPVYQLRLNNLTKGSYAIAIKDETGVVLYNETVAGTKLVRNYQFDTAVPEGAKLTFEVNDLTNNTSKVYNVSKTATVVENVVVNEVK
ncbi:MAG: hypothetical protein J7539_09540 [Niabella sp.]|nr:hypothetical protein [Niabella sp.]